MGIAVLQFRAPNPAYGCAATYSGLTVPIAPAALTGEGSQLRFGGRTSPGALVAILVKDNLLDIGSASATGEFEIVLDLADIQALLSSEVGSLEFTLLAQDRLRLQTDRVTVYAQVGAGGLSDYNISLMPPTLKVLTPSINLNEGLTLAGSAVPSTEVVVVISGGQQEHTVVTGLDGFWSVWLSGPWEVGSQTVEVFNRDSQGRESSMTLPEGFTVALNSP